MNHLIIDETIGFVRKIVENIRCAICNMQLRAMNPAKDLPSYESYPFPLSILHDKTDGQRLRYACGHTACDDCVIDAVDCQLCLTLPQVTGSQPRLDNALTERVKNTSELLTVCQNLFNTDVFQRRRLSEQLRIEKELFPECIQAPMKYANKRKSNINSYKNKENKNTTFFPGEGTSLLCENITMDSSATYVQQWLKKNEKDFTRKPFRDLNVNTQSQQNITLPKDKYKLPTIYDENVSVLKTNRKRSHFKTTEKNTPLLRKNMKSIIHQHNGNQKRFKKELHMSSADFVKNKTKTKCDIDESGIFMDDDPIVIDDSQETVIDKDKNAWLAVLKANENEEIESTSLVNLDFSDHKTLNYTNKESPMDSDGLQSKINPNIKVPFYKKSYIIETCTYCNTASAKATALPTGQPEKVEITIDNANYTTTIKILKHVQNSSKLNTTNSASVQTDITETMPIDDIAFTKNENDGREDVVSQKSDTQSEDLFAEEGPTIETECKQNILQDSLVIAESDSDMEMELSGPVPVKVDVHRSCDESEYGVLSEIVNTEERDTRPRRGPRGLTPTSTDSSDKENYNPNRMKKNASKKKKHTKK